MDAEITEMGVPAWSFDDMFVEDAFAALKDEQPIAQPSPILPSKGSPTPSTESEQSLALDFNEARDFDFGAFTNSDSGLMLDAFDIAPPPYQVPQADPQGTNDATMVQTFGASFGLFGDLSQIGANANTLGMDTDYLSKLLCNLPTQPAAAIEPAAGLQSALANTDWTASFSVITTPTPTSIAPADLTIQSPSLKRKESTSSSSNVDQIEHVTKRPRGRPPKSRPTQSGSISPVLGRLQGSPKSYTTPSTPLLNELPLDDDPTPASKRTASGKPSTARPKSVVPEKHFKDGTAQAITGMTMEQILAFPTYDELLKQVAPEKQAGAREFGERIAENRDRAKDAAKKSRDEKRQKIEQLEGQVDGLEDQVARMKQYLAVLLGSGRVSPVEVAAFL